MSLKIQKCIVYYRSITCLLLCEGDTWNKQWGKRGLSYWGNWLWWNRWDALHPLYATILSTMNAFMNICVCMGSRRSNQSIEYPHECVRCICAEFATVLCSGLSILTQFRTTTCPVVYNIFPAQVHFPYLNIIFRCGFHKPLWPLNYCRSLYLEMFQINLAKRLHVN